MQSCAVIGCGPAGMAASTVLRQSGLLVTCFDVAPTPGGIWSSNARDVFSSRGCLSPIYPPMRCVLPKELMCFSDVRFDYTVPQFPHHTAVQHYLHQYASQKGVRGMTRFNTKVESLRYDAADRLWKLISVNVVSGDVMEWSFDKVCVCTGQTQEARFPAGLRETLQGYTREGGEVHHAAHVKDFRAFRSKRVVVVGDGVSAYDYCVELKRMGAEVIHSTTMQRTSDAAAGLSSSQQQQQQHGEGRGRAPANTNAARPSLTSSLWRNTTADGAGTRGGSSTEGDDVSDLRVAADAATRLAGFVARLPWLRNDVHTARDVVRKWLRYRNARVESIPSVGLPIDNDGRGLRFTADPSAQRSTAEVVAEAKESHPVIAASSGVFLDHVDAVICATGYTRRYPFLHADIRRVLEEDPPLLVAASVPEGSSSADAASAAAVAQPADADVPPRRPDTSKDRRGLYLGTLWAAEPSLALVGHQRELLPPFLLFEAQSRFIAYAFTQRMPLPDSVAAMAAKEAQLLHENPLLDDLYSNDGVGLHSAVYFNVLQQELGVSSRDTYTAKVMQRQRWLLASTIVRVYHKFRSMAPLKRKQQHVLFSNKV